jgi:hypothetical protein
LTAPFTESGFWHSLRKNSYLILPLTLTSTLASARMRLQVGVVALLAVSLSGWVLCNQSPSRLRLTYSLVQDKTRTTLTMEDLSAALSEYGINARKPDFYM